MLDQNENCRLPDCVGYKPSHSGSTAKKKPRRSEAGVCQQKRAALTDAATSPRDTTAAAASAASTTSAAAAAASAASTTWGLLFAEPGCSCVLLVAWPKAKITLRQAARIIHKSWEG